MPPVPSDFLPTSPIEEAREYARHLRAAINTKVTRLMRGSSAWGRIISNRYAKTGQPDAAAWTELALMFDRVNNHSRANPNWVEISSLTRAIEKSLGIEGEAVKNINSMGALSGLSTQARNEGGITAIMEKGLGGKPLPPDVQAEIMSNLSGAPPSVRSPAAQLSAAKAATGMVGGPGGQTGPGRKGRKTRASRKSKSKKRTTRRR